MNIAEKIAERQRVHLRPKISNKYPISKTDIIHAGIE
jgi:hypothetical protein